MNDETDKINIAVIEGTTRPQRESIKVARFIEKIGKTYDELSVLLVDPVDFNLPGDGNDPEGKDPRYTKITEMADGFFIVTPEYNRSFPGSLKRLLDSELKNYIHKPVVFAGASSGAFGGVRAIESLIHVTREMGMLPSFAEVPVPFVQDAFDEFGNPKDPKIEERVRAAYAELIWLAKATMWAKQNVPNKFHKKD